ncbi:MAG: hypothetical protein AABY22_15810 [Nanoarchaeota archaeon]
MKKYMNIFVVIFIVGTILFNLIFRYIHRDMTESQLFFNYWYLWFGILVIGIGGVYLNEKTK